MGLSPVPVSGARSPRRAVLLAFGVSLLLSGCYTLLHHPGEQADLTLGDDCLQCHTEDDFMTPAYTPWVDYYSHSEWPWINYYGSPWWFDDYWVQCPQSPEDGSAAEERTGGRQLWVRRLRGGQSFSPDSTRFRDPQVVTAPIISAPPSAAPAVGAAQDRSDSSSNQSAGEKEKEKPRKRSIRR
jgi:hypothetical protein